MTGGGAEVRGAVSSAQPPVPPPGPGVQVPFGAPPGERDRRRLWIGLGVGGALLAICCVGGIFGFGALVVQTSRGLLNEATTVVGDYLDGLRRGDYPYAYDQLCVGLRATVGLDQFKAEDEAQTRVRGYVVGQPRPQGSSIWVAATVVRASGQEQRPEFQLVQEGKTATALKICAIRQ
jgi:hypothetical protein